MTFFDLMPLILPAILIQLLIQAWYIKHCWDNERLTSRRKAFWIAIIAGLSIMGAALYLLMTRPKGPEPLPESAADLNLPYSRSSQTKQGILVFLLVTFEVFALRLIYENQNIQAFPQLMLLLGSLFALLIVNILFGSQIKLKLLRYGLPFLMLAISIPIIYLDQFQNSQMIVLALVAILINLYSLRWGTIYYAGFFAGYLITIIARESQMITDSVLFDDYLISRLYADTLFFILVFITFYSLGRQQLLNRQLEKGNEDLAETLETTRRQALQLKEMSVLDERQRIIGEIHDTVGHTLTTAVIALESSNTLLEKDPAAAKAKVELALHQTRQSLGDLRGAIRTMQSGDNRSLESRLLQLVGEITGTTELRINLIYELKSQPLPIHQTVMLNAVKEFVTNSLKHGRATAVDILLQEYDQAYHLLINDDGHGTSDISFGFGLQTIRNRTESLGGTMQVESSPDEGFSMQISLPAGQPLEGGSQHD